MANFVFNIAKGRAAELYDRVDGNDPANCALILVPLSASGSEAQGQDADTLAAVLALEQFTEQSSGNWARKTLTDSELAAGAVDDSGNTNPRSLPAVTWEPGPEEGNDTTGLLICYDPDTEAGTDANIVPIVHCDFAVTADGNKVELEPSEFFSAA